MESSPPHSHDSHEDPDALPDGITRATIKRAVDRAMHPYKYAVMDNIQLIVVTAVVAYLLHKFLRRKKADRYNAHVLGTAADSDVNNRADWTKQSDANTSDKGVKDTKPRKSGGNSTISAAKDAASNRNYEKLSAKAMSESEQPSASKELGSKESNRNYEKLSAKATPESEQPSASKELGSKEDAGTGVASYLNLDKFMSGTIGGVHSLFKECGTNQSADGTNQPSSSSTSNITTPTVELHTTAKHPGLEAYYHWKSTIMSLYRVYAIPLYSYPPSADGASHIQDAILPMQPSSERGNTPVYIEVMNLTSQNVAVYWIDYKGNEVYKGSMRAGDTWAQTTWIGHPWVFRKKTPGGMNDGGQESVLLKYVPFRVIPSIEGAETILHEESGETVGIQRFLLKDTPKDFGVIMDGQKWTPACVVEDFIMPEPPLVSLRSDGLSGSNASGKYLEALDFCFGATIPSNAHPSRSNVYSYHRFEQAHG